MEYRNRNRSTNIVKVWVLLLYTVWSVNDGLSRNLLDIDYAELLMGDATETGRRRKGGKTGRMVSVAYGCLDG